MYFLYPVLSPNSSLSLWVRLSFIVLLSILFNHVTQRLSPLLPGFQNKPVDAISSLLLSLLPRFQATDAKINKSPWCSRWYRFIKSLPPAVTAQQTFNCILCITAWPLLYWRGLFTYRAIICWKTKAQVLHKLKKFPGHMGFQDRVLKRPQIYALVLVPKKKKKKPYPFTEWVSS